MNDRTLTPAKHSRVLVPCIAVMLAVSIARLFSDSLLMQQVRGITTMLLAIGITLYALDSVVRFIFVLVTVRYPASNLSVITGFAVANLVLAFVLWGLAWLLSRRQNNYIER